MLYEVITLGFELRHVGINCQNEKEANHTTDLFEKMFGMEKKPGGNSIFAGTAIEALKTPYLGAKGHIAIATNSVDRAVAFLEKQGIEFDMSTAKYNNNKLTVVRITSYNVCYTKLLR